MNAARINEQDFIIDQEQYRIPFESKECSIDPTWTCVVKYNVYTYPRGETEQNAWSSAKTSISTNTKTATHIFILLQ